MESVNPIQQEIRRLSLRLAVARYELKEAILKGIPLSSCTHICVEIAICKLQRSALRNGRFEELPYNVRILFKG